MCILTLTMYNLSTDEQFSKSPLTDRNGTHRANDNFTNREHSYDETKWN